jgi:hypothetical protein
MTAGPSGPDPDPDPDVDVGVGVAAGEDGGALVGPLDFALGVGKAECEDAGWPVAWPGFGPARAVW